MLSVRVAVPLLVVCFCAKWISGSLHGPGNQYVIEGANLNLTCSSDEVTKHITWEVLSKDWVQIGENFVVSNIKKGDIVQSTIRMENISSSYDQAIVSCSISDEEHQLRIYVMPLNETAVISGEETEKINSTAGASVKLVCAITGGTNPVIMWKRDNCILKEDEGVSTSTFEIPVIMETDGGLYTCSVYEKKHRHFSYVVLDKKMFHLSVEMSLTRSIPEEGELLTVPQGSDAFLYCAIAGYPIDLTWTRNDEETLDVMDDIYSSKTHQRDSKKCELKLQVGPKYSVQEKAKTLVIHNITLEDEGTYRCRGQQEEKTLDHTFLLKLSGHIVTPSQGLLILLLSIAFCHISYEQN